jgi:GNAT superfamily N-acetyltransferase
MGSDAIDVATVEPAGQRDGRQIYELRRAVEDWLSSRGIEQWPVGEISSDDVQSQVAAGEWHVLRAGDDLAGAFRLQWSDEMIWQHENGFAAYVHSLMVNRGYAGRGVGERLLHWAAVLGQDGGATELRLDCGEGSLRLREYYAGLGFREVGRRDFEGDWYSVVLFSKSLT